MRALKRLLAITLLAFLGLHFVSPFVFAADGGKGVEACCLRNGRHACSKSAAELAKALQHAPVMGAVPARCPYAPAGLAVVHNQVSALSTAQTVYAGWRSHPVAAQTASKLRISQSRSRQKRGPPGVVALQLLFTPSKLSGYRY